MLTSRQARPGNLAYREHVDCDGAIVRVDSLVLVDN
jgi:hypothetical protein